MAGPAFSVAALSRSVNRPTVTISAVIVALALGTLHAPYLHYLRPFGEFYVALLQMCVLPFLLTTIPLAVRSAMTSGSAASVVRRLVVWSALAAVAMAVIAIVVASLVFHFFAIDEATLARIGAFVATSSDRVDVEFALDPGRAGRDATSLNAGLLAFVPTNIFAALSGNDSMRVLVFMAIFGIAMVTTERQSGYSIFNALRHIQMVCILIFDWFSLLVPVGIVALIAPQIDLMGAEIFAVLGMFAYAFFAASAAVLAGAIVVVTLALRVSPRHAFVSLLRPMMLGAATRNTLVCIPMALETMKQDLATAKQPCDLFVPVGFAVLRFGTILYFIIATMFMATLLGRSFSVMDLVWVAVLATAASFATLGVTGIAALAPLGAVLRPFGLSYELAVPLMIIVDPITNMIRVMINVGLNCAIPAMAGGREPVEASVVASRSAVAATST